METHYYRFWKLITTVYRDCGLVEKGKNLNGNSLLPGYRKLETYYYRNKQKFEIQKFKRKLITTN